MRRASDLEDKLSRADVIDTSKLSGETITFGATVTVIEQNTVQKSVWKIVGEPGVGSPASPQASGFPHRDQAMCPELVLTYL